MIGTAFVDILHLEMQSKSTMAMCMHREIRVFCLILLFCGFLPACQKSNENADEEPPATYRISGEVTLTKSVLPYVVGGTQKTLFLFLTRQCPIPEQEPRNLISELQIPEAYPVSSNAPERGIPFEFFGVKKGSYFLSGFANISKGGLGDTEYNAGDLVYFDDGALGCLRVEVNDETPESGVTLRLNHVVTAQDPPVFIF